MVLDQRLATIIAAGGEPMIAQIKLAWWRERLNERSEQWPAGEPLLDRLKNTGIDHTRFIHLVDGFEAMLAEDFRRSELTTYLRGKERAWAAVSDAVQSVSTNKPVEQAARELALFELGGKLTAACEVALVSEVTSKEHWLPAELSSQMRPLAVLHTLARRARLLQRTELLEGPMSMVVAMRVGLFGR